jgi:ubiquinone/menaquinone biosynthesis C-methylase UbiE
MLAPMSTFDAVAPIFDRHRSLPHGVPEAIRAAILGVIDAPSPRLLDLGAGTGRIGWAFVRGGDDYVGVDLSLGMLRAFREREPNGAPRLLQADGEQLPFRDGAFDAVMLIQVLGGARGWRRLLDEARRVLGAVGALVIGRTLTPDDGIDARMKERLAGVLGEMGVEPSRTKARENAQSWLEANTAGGTRVIAARWTAARTPRGFLERHRTGARFAALPAPVKDAALRQLAAWATATFDSLDTVFSERHEFELHVFRFE